MFFSVIIPNYNHSLYLEERILSVLNQTYKNFELIILDDASTDFSREIILRYKAHPSIAQIIFNDQNSDSPFRQWKKGIELAKYDWIWIAESDDLADPGFLNSASEILKATNVKAYYCDSFVITENNEILDRTSEIKNRFFETGKWSLSYEESGVRELNQCLKFLCTINNASSFIFRKEIFKTIEHTITDFRYYGDWFLYINAALQTSIYYNHLALSSYRHHSHNLVNDDMPVARSKWEYFQILQFLLSRPEITDKKELINFFSLHYLGWGWISHGPINGFVIVRSFFRMNKKLALKVTLKIIWYKIRGRKNKKAYP